VFVCYAPSNFFFVSRWNRAIFWPSVLHVALYKTDFFDFWFRPLTPKICTKLPISRFVWQIDRRCLGLPGSFRGWPIQWNHAKCCGAVPCCHGNDIWARRRDPVAYRLVPHSAVFVLKMPAVSLHRLGCEQNNLRGLWHVSKTRNIFGSSCKKTIYSYKKNLAYFAIREMLQRIKDHLSLSGFMANCRWPCMCIILISAVKHFDTQQYDYWYTGLDGWSVTLYKHSGIETDV